MFFEKTDFEGKSEIVCEDNRNLKSLITANSYIVGVEASGRLYKDVEFSDLNLLFAPSTALNDVSELLIDDMRGDFPASIRFM